MKRISLIALALITAGFALVGCRHSSPEARAEWMVKHISRKLDLNAEQRAKLDDAKVAFLDARKRHQADQQRHAEDVNALILSDKLDQAKALSLLEGRQGLVKQEAPALIAKMAVFHDSLNADQKKKLIELIENLRQRLGIRE